MKPYPDADVEGVVPEGLNRLALFARDVRGLRRGNCQCGDL
jgi:hypothetical protein